MESHYSSALLIALAVLLFQLTTFMNEVPTLHGLVKEDSVVLVDLYTTNSTSHHIYPYLASFITFVCIFVSLMMVICYAPLLGR